MRRSEAKPNRADVEAPAVSPKLLVGAAAMLSVVLVGVYLGAGGGGYEPTPVADPCTPRAWTSPDSIAQDAQQFFLSALDGAACELGVSRETLAAALASAESRARFAAERGIGDADLETAVRAGIDRAIDDAEAAGALDPIVADGLRTVADQLPVDEAIGLIDDAAGLFGDAGSVIDQLGGLLGQAGDLLP